MATQPEPFIGTTVTAPNNGGAAAAALVQPYDNTDKVTIYNTSTTVGVLFQIRAATVSTTNPVATSSFVPAGGSFTVKIGTTSGRNPFGTGAGQKTIYYCTDSGSATAAVKITYNVGD
tara:strand:+ start:5799 stop:6152 length:354 start_codon:yes stop_codon:yes gene_type:complete